ncbi:hypothetical protein [Dietzia sp. 179-F 9C3 NHS]|uniref:hypothetical protein n=1 Tax=Dietzia sp. 179-F 9C3 NHS TaxID=3374295 RepID=UPI0038799F3D
MTTSTTLKGFAAVAAAAALAVAGAGASTAQNVIPGDDNKGRTVVVGAEGMEIEFVSVARGTGQVVVSLTNNTGQSLRCEAPNEDTSARPGGTVSTAEVVGLSEQFYSSYQNTQYENVVHGSVGQLMQLWPLGQLIPTGSAAQFLSDRVQLEADIANAHQQAKQHGYVGTTPAFTINDGATVERTIQLGQPAVSPRGDARLGYFTICGPGGTQGTQQLYAWSAYEEPTESEPGEDPAPNGSLDLGSLGS